MKYTIEIPDELNKYMVEGGWDVQAYIKQVLLDPLIKRFENEKKTTILSEKLAEVDAQVKDIHTKAEVKDFAVERAEIVAETTASVFAANGIKVFLFDAMRPTPELSFTVRLLGAMTRFTVPPPS